MAIILYALLYPKARGDGSRQPTDSEEKMQR
jgi:hypothetical protein